MKKTIAILVILVVIIAIFVVRFKKENSNPSQGTLKIGAALALTGDAAPWGEASRNAAELAVEEINAKGGINGQPLELVVEDIKSSSKDSVTAISKLLNIDKVNAVMITWLDSYQGAQNIVPQNVPLISQDAAIESVNVPVNHPNVYSLWYRTAAKAQVTFDAMKLSGVKTVYVITQNDSYYATLVDFLKTEAKKQGIEIVEEEVLNPDNDVKTVLAKVQSRKSDAVFFGAYDERLSVDFVKRYNEQIKGSISLYGDEFLEQNLLAKKIDVSWIEGAKYYVPAAPSAEFATKYKAKFGTDPVFSAINTYDTIYVLARYLADKPSNLSQYMRVTEFDTLTYGKIKFDEIGGVVSNTSAIVEKVVRNGKLEVVGN